MGTTFMIQKSKLFTYLSLNGTTITTVVKVLTTVVKVLTTVVKVFHMPLVSWAVIGINPDDHHELHAAPASATLLTPQSEQQCKETRRWLALDCHGLDELPTTQ